MWHGQQLPITFHLVPTPAPTSTPRYVGTPISAVSLLAGPDLRITQNSSGIMVFHSGILEYSNIPLVEFQWNIGIFQESGSSCAGAPTTVPVPTPPFLMRVVCVCYSFSLFFELEISEAQRAHAHSAPARTAAPGTPLSRMPLSRRVCVCYIFFRAEDF